jgi:hypothetical protein
MLFGLIALVINVPSLSYNIYQTVTGLKKSAVLRPIAQGYTSRAACAVEGTTV